MKRLLLPIWSVLLSSCPAIAQDALLQPIWSSEPATRYLERLAQNTAFSSGSNEFGRIDSYSFPVIGLEEGFTSDEPDSRLSNAFIGDADAVVPNDGVGESNSKWWPACAGQVPKPEVARDETGTWYYGTYDFGCLQVTIAGDLQKSGSASEELTDAISDKSSSSSSPVDETGIGEDVLSISETVVRFGVPYSVTFDCTEESKTLCQNKADRTELISRLTIRAGRPQ